MARTLAQLRTSHFAFRQGYAPLSADSRLARGGPRCCRHLKLDTLSEWLLCFGAILHFLVGGFVLHARLLLQYQSPIAAKIILWSMLAAPVVLLPLEFYENWMKKERKGGYQDWRWTPAHADKHRLKRTFQDLAPPQPSMVGANSVGRHQPAPLRAEELKPLLYLLAVAAEDNFKALLKRAKGRPSRELLGMALQELHQSTHVQLVDRLVELLLERADRDKDHTVNWTEFEEMLSHLGKNRNYRCRLKELGKLGGDVLVGAGTSDAAAAAATDQEKQLKRSLQHYDDGMREIWEIWTKFSRHKADEAMDARREGGQGADGVHPYFEDLRRVSRGERMELQQLLRELEVRSGSGGDSGASPSGGTAQDCNDHDAARMRLAPVDEDGLLSPRLMRHSSISTPSERQRAMAQGRMAGHLLETVAARREKEEALLAMSATNGTQRALVEAAAAGQLR